MFTWQFGKRSGFTSTAQERGYSASAPESSATEPAQSPCAWVHFVKFLNLHMKITYLTDKGQNECVGPKPATRGG